MSTTSEENARLASRYFVGVMNDNTFDETALSDDYIAHMGSNGVAPLEDIKAKMTHGYEAFPDRAVELEEVIANDRDVVIRWRMTGTHEGPLMGIDPTGSKVDIVGFIQFRFEDGKITEAWSLSDQFALFEQLGVVDSPTG